jgi:hypothetical protein
MNIKKSAYIDGKTDFGESSPAKPAFIVPEPWIQIAK